MPRKPKANDTEEVKYRPTVQIAAYLDELIKTGLYGNSRPEAVNFLVRDQIKLLQQQGELKKPE